MAVVIAAVLLIGSGGYLLYGLAQSRATTDRAVSEMIRAAAEGLVGIGIARIDAAVAEGELPPLSLSEALDEGPARGARWGLTVRRHSLDHGLWKVSVAVDHTLLRHTLQVIIERRRGLPPVPGAFQGALTSYFGFDLKNVDVDGNNYTSNGERVFFDDTYAIATATGDVHFSTGSGTVAGHGTEPSQSLDEQTLTDFEGESFPTTPYEVLGLESPDDYPDNARTFDTIEAWDAYVATLPTDPDTGRRQMHDHSFLHLSFEQGHSVMFEHIDWGESEHVLIWHHPGPVNPEHPDAPTGTAWAQNIHLGKPEEPFRGIAILDAWRHVNGGSSVRGGFFSLSASLLSGLQGNTSIEYSTEAIGKALRDAGGVDEEEATPPRVLSYREGVDDPDMRAALVLADVVVTGDPAEDAEVWEAAILGGGPEL